MNVDPRLIFAPELLVPEAKELVIAQLHQLPVSASIKRATFARWCELVGTPKRSEDLDRAALSMS